MIVDATIINAPSSTKNAEKKRDPEIHQTKKGNEWRFGMKCHVGADAGTGLVHTIEVTPANTHDIKVTSKLIRSDDPVIVVSNNYFNRSGMVIACPIVKTALPGPLHIPLKDSEIEGIVLCEQVRYLDLSSRRWSKLTQTHYFDIMDISDAVVSMLEYQ